MFPHRAEVHYVQILIHSVFIENEDWRAGINSAGLAGLEDMDITELLIAILMKVFPQGKYTCTLGSFKLQWLFLKKKRRRE